MTGLLLNLHDFLNVSQKQSSNFKIFHMKHMLKGIISLFVLISLITGKSSFAQDVEFKRSGNWEFLYDVEGVNFFYKNCEFHDDYNGIHTEYVIFRIENTRDDNVVVSYDLQMYYNNECFNCNSIGKKEYHLEKTVFANDFLESCCGADRIKGMSMCSRFLQFEVKETVLTKFELVNLHITKL